MAVACVVAGVDRAFSNLLDPRLSLALDLTLVAEM